MKKKILSILLLGAMLVSLVACGGDGKGNDDTKDTTDVSGTENSAYAGIEKKNYGKELNILYHNPDSAYFTYFFTEENDGEAMQVAVYNRELKIEDHLGIEINWVIANNAGDTSINAVYPSLQQMAMTGDNLYQIAFTHCIQDTAILITDGLLTDLNTVSTINLDNEWWNQRSNENLSAGGKQYYVVSDFTIPDVYTVLFNKEMVKTNNLEDPYQLVRDGKWTLDKMRELGEAVLLDNGDGIWDINDTYGFGAPGEHMLTAFTYSCGLQIVEKDEDGNFTFALNNQKTYDVVDKLKQLFDSPATYYYEWYHDAGVMGGSVEKSLNISTGRCLFGLKALSSLDEYRNIDIDFGILPYPKYDENQEDYLSLDWGVLTCVPLVSQDKEMTGEALELFAFLAKDEVLPTFYDIMLGEKLSRDPESREMLDIIFDGVIFDAGMNYFGFSKGVRDFWSLPNSIATGTMTGYGSFLEKYEENAIATLDEFNNAVN